MMQLGPSGTPWPGRSGTAFPDDREPNQGDSLVHSEGCAALNRPNQESCGFLLTPANRGQSGAESELADRAARAGAMASKAAPAGAGDDPLTHVTLSWPQGQRSHWLRFGKPVATRCCAGGRRIESYAPGQVFALVRWAGHDHGTALSHLAIVRAMPRGSPVARLAAVDPGGEILLSVQGWRRVARVFAVIAAIEALGLAPQEVAPDHWRQIHDRLAARAVARIDDTLCQAARRAPREMQP